MPRVARQLIGHRGGDVGVRAIARAGRPVGIVWEAEAVSDGQVAQARAAHRADGHAVALAYRRGPVFVGGRVDALA